MKSIITKYFILGILIGESFSVSAQQKQRTSERSFQQEVQKANRLKDHRNNMLQKMESRERINNDQRSKNNVHAIPNSNNRVIKNPSTGQQIKPKGQ
jgi:hypothetical protein